MKHYCPTGRRNHGRPLKRLLDTWDRNGSTGGLTPWKIYDDDIILNSIMFSSLLCPCPCFMDSRSPTQQISVVLVSVHVNYWVTVRIRGINFVSCPLFSCFPSYSPVFSPCGATAPSGPWPPHSWGCWITLRHTTVGRTPLDEWSAHRRDLYLTTHNTHNRQPAMPPAAFEPGIPAGERPPTDALDRAATGAVYCPFNSVAYPTITTYVRYCTNSIFLRARKF